MNMNLDQRIRQAVLRALRFVAIRSAERVTVIEESDFKDEVILKDLGFHPADLRLIVVKVEQLLSFRSETDCPTMTDGFNVGHLIAFFNQQLSPATD